VVPPKFKKLAFQFQALKIMINAQTRFNLIYNQNQ